MSLIDKVIIELSYRVDEGYPKLETAAHRAVLRDILIEWGVEKDLVSEAMYRLLALYEDDGSDEEDVESDEEDKEENNEDIDGE